MKFKIITRLLIYGCLFFTSYSCLAEESDPFGGLDEAIAETKKEDRVKTSIARKFADNLTLRLKSRGYYRFTKPKGSIIDNDQQKYHGGTRMILDSSTGMDSWNMGLNMWAEYGSKENLYSGLSEFFQDDSHHRRYLEVNELYFTYFLDNTDITVGKKEFNKGFAVFPLTSPLQRYGRWDLVEPTNPRRLGTWQATIDYAKGDNSFSFTVFPVFPNPKLPVHNSIWLGEQDAFPDSTLLTSISPDFFSTLSSFNDFIGLDTQQIIDFFNDLLSINGLSTGTPISTFSVSEELPDEKLDEFGFYADYKTSFAGLDLMFSGYHGPSVYPVLEIQPTGGLLKIIKQNPMVNNLSTGFSTTYKNLEFHGEALLSFSEGRKDDSYVNYVGGVIINLDTTAQRLHLNSCSVSLEYAGEIEMYEQDHDNYLISSKDARLWTDNFNVVTNTGINDAWNINTLHSTPLSGDGLLNHMDINWQVTEQLKWSIGGEHFHGNNDRYFGIWRDNDRIISSFDFVF